MKNKIIAFAKRVEAESNADLIKAYPPNPNGNGYDPTKTFKVKFGRKYAKITSHDSNGMNGGVWAFVNMVTGDIFKPASWKAPAKHARGNIETAAYGKNYVWTGPNYLRGY